MNARLRTLVCVAIVASFGGLIISSSAWADRAPNGTWVKNIYYSDATHSTIVGMRKYDCDSQLTASGTQSAYSTYTFGSCAGGVGDGNAGGGSGPGGGCPGTYIPDPFPVCE